MSVMSVSTTTLPPGSMRSARAGVRQHVDADAAGHAVADQPFARPAPRRTGLAPVPAERRAPSSMHWTSWRSLNGRSRVRSFSGSLSLRNATGSMPDLLRDLVHRALDGHHADRFARRAHGAGFGQVQLDDPVGEPTVLAGIEREAAERDGLEESRARSFWLTMLSWREGRQSAVPPQASRTRCSSRSGGRPGGRAAGG